MSERKLGHLGSDCAGSCARCASTDQYCTVLEDSSCIPKHKINGPHDCGVSVKLAQRMCIQRVLVSVDQAVLESCLVTIHSQGNSLMQSRTCCVAKCHPLSYEVCCIHSCKNKTTKQNKTNYCNRKQKRSSSNNTRNKSPQFLSREPQLPKL